MIIKVLSDILSAPGGENEGAERHGWREQGGGGPRRGWRGDSIQPQTRLKMRGGRAFFYEVHAARLAHLIAEVAAECGASGRGDEQEP